MVPLGVSGHVKVFCRLMSTCKCVYFFLYSPRMLPSTAPALDLFTLSTKLCIIHDVTYVVPHETAGQTAVDTIKRFSLPTFNALYSRRSAVLHLDERLRTIRLQINP